MSEKYRTATNLSSLVSGMCLVTIGMMAATIAINPLPARADTVAYLVNVTMRPGYNFPNAQAALDYGELICARVGANRVYADVVSDVKADFSISETHQASYLITQAVNELCPALIWRLRNSASANHPQATP